jgi:hypothetical protein
MEKGCIKVGGVFSFEHMRNGKLIDKWEEKNIVVNEGLNYLLGSALSADTPSTSWFIGLFEGNYTPGANDTLATFPAAATECTAYTEVNRVAWVDAGAASQAITNSASKANFTMNATKNVYGAFICNANTGATGKLFAASKFAAMRPVISGDIILVTYTIQAASA